MSTLRTLRLRPLREPRARPWTRSRAVPAAAVALLALVAAVIFAHYTGQVRTFYIMPDEMLWSRLGLEFHEHPALLWHVRGLPIDTVNGLYPVLTSPAYWWSDMQDALRVVHVVNAILMASAAIPTYLLAARVAGSRLLAFLAAAFSVAIPWMALSTIVFSEAAAYPAFLWALLAMQRAVDEPGRGRDAVALIAIVAAYSARTQFIVLAPAFLAAVLIHDLLLARAASPRPAVRGALRGVVTRHEVLAAVTAAALVVLVVLAAAGSLHVVLGPYTTLTHDGLPPRGLLLDQARLLLAWTIFGGGVLPFVAGVAWMLGRVVRPVATPAYAFAVVGVVVTLTLVATATLYTARYSGGDRYLFYIVPLLGVGMAVALAGTAGRTPVVTAAIALLLACWAMGTIDFTTVMPPHASPTQLANAVFYYRPIQLGRKVGIHQIDHRLLLWLVAAAAAVVTVWLGRRADRTAAAVAIAVVLVFCGWTTRYVFARMVDAPMGPPAPVTLQDRGWVDGAVPANAQVGLVPSPLVDWFHGARVWWDTEYANRRVTRVYSVDGSDTYSQLPVRTLAVDPDSGRLGIPGSPSHLVLSSDFVRFEPRGRQVRVSPTRVIAGQPVVLRLVALDRSSRARWTVTGIDADNYVRAGHPARIRVFGDGRRRALALSLTFQYAPPVTEPARAYVVRAGRATAAGSVPATNDATTPVTICVPARGFRDVWADVRHAPARDRADDGLRIVHVAAAPARQGCR